MSTATPSALPTRRIVALLTALVLSIGGLALAGTAGAPPARAADLTVYDAIPAPLPSNVASLGFSATRTSEFGDLVQLAPGTSRTIDRVEVGFSSWACETGAWNTGDCVTTPDATFTHPVTVTLYAVGSGGAVGAAIASATETITAPFRPSADTVNCTGGKWWDGAACVSGLLFTASFDFSADAPVVGDQVIVGVAFDTKNAGASPLPVVGPYDALNVAVEGQVSVGADVDDTVYLNSSVAGSYETPGATGVFRADPGWAEYGTLMISLVADQPSASEPPATTPTVPATAEEAIAASGEALPPTVAAGGTSGSARTLTLNLGPDFANQWFFVTAYSAPTAIGWVWVGPTGSVTFPLPDTLPAGLHTIALVDASGNVVAHVAGVSVAALLAASGIDTATTIVGSGLAVALLLLGATTVALARRSRAALES